MEIERKHENHAFTTSMKFTSGLMWHLRLSPDILSNNMQLISFTDLSKGVLRPGEGHLLLLSESYSIL